MESRQFNSVITCCEDGITHSQWMIGDESYQFAPITHLCTNPLEELLTACDDLLEGRSGLIYWFHEPRITKITLSILPDAEHLLVSINPIPLLPHNRLITQDADTFVFKTTIQQFLLVIFYEMQKIISLQDVETSQYFNKATIFPRKLFNAFKERMNHRLRDIRFKNTVPNIH